MPRDADDRSDYFTWGADVVLTQCAYCRRQAPGPELTCEAFPGGIPDEITRNEVDHRRPYLDPATGEPADTGVAGDVSLTFEPTERITPLALRTLYAHLDKLGR